MCAGDNDGRLDAMGIGGYPPYNFFWQDGSINQPSINNLSAGEYTVTVVDSRTTISDDTLTLIEPTSIELGSPTVTNETGGQSNGSIEISNITGGTPPYTILWDTGDTTFTLINLRAGTYNLSVTDANGCIVTNSVIVDNLSSTEENIISSASIYPTLVRSGEQLQVKNLPQSIKYSAEIYNSTGQLMFRQLNGQGEKSLDIPPLKSGNYFLRLITERAFITKRFVVVP